MRPVNPSKELLRTGADRRWRWRVRPCRVSPAGGLGGRALLRPVALPLVLCVVALSGCASSGPWSSLSLDLDQGALRSVLAPEPADERCGSMLGAHTYTVRSEQELGLFGSPPPLGPCIELPEPGLPQDR